MALPNPAYFLLHVSAFVANVFVLVSIEASKDGVKFTCAGDIGNGAVTLRSHTNVDKPELNVDIELTEPVSLTFSLKYLVINFAKLPVFQVRQALPFERSPTVG